MIKFIHKKHINRNIENGKIIIYYSVSDIILGIILVSLVIFFIHDYLVHSFEKKSSTCFSYPQSALDTANKVLKK